MTQHFPVCLIYLRALLLQEMKLFRGWNIFLIRGVSHNKPRNFIQLMKSEPHLSGQSKKCHRQRIIMLQDALEIMGSLRKAILHSLDRVIQPHLFQQSSMFNKDKSDHPACNAPILKIRRRYGDVHTRGENNLMHTLSLSTGNHLIVIGVPTGNKYKNTCRKR